MQKHTSCFLVILNANAKKHKFEQQNISSPRKKKSAAQKKISSLPKKSFPPQKTKIGFWLQPLNIVLDAGLISQIPPAMNANFVLFIQGMCGGDANAITDQLLVFDNRNAVAGLVNKEVQLQRPQLLNTVQQACDHWVDPKTGMAPDG